MFENESLSEEKSAGVIDFNCRVESARMLSSTLTSLLGSRKEAGGSGGGGASVCRVEATEDQLIFTVSSLSQSTQTRASFPAACFEEYRLHPRAMAVSFSADLGALVDCLQLHGPHCDSAALTLAYSSERALLCLRLEEEGVLTAADLPVLLGHDQDQDKDEEDDPHSGGGSLFLAFKQSPEACAIIFRSEQLRDALQDLLDTAGAARVEYQYDAGSREVSVSARGAWGGSRCAFPQDSAALVSTVSGSQSATWQYPAAAFAQGMRALAVARETCVRLSGEGVLCVQHQIPLPQHQQQPTRTYNTNHTPAAVTYIDFLMLPLDTTGDEEEEAAPSNHYH